MLVIGSLSSAALACLAGYSLYCFGDLSLDVCKIIKSSYSIVPYSIRIDMKLCCNKKCIEIVT